MKKFLSIVAISLLLVLSTACGNETGILAMEDSSYVNTIVRSAEFPIYESIEHLAENATDILRVEILDERVEVINTWIPPQNEYEDTGMDMSDVYFVFTVHRVRVQEVFQGNAQVGDIIEVMQHGGETDEVRIVFTDKVSFEEGDDLVLFLHSWINMDGVASLANPLQSAYRFTTANDDARLRNLNDELESLNSKNDLTLTLNDLSWISQER
ncbi:MAG: hypothetical protein FWC91_10900 [Defluviitaleaceae bacterium]|nr:hypothetical protein [Defluviitaleaceae bacterium]